MKTKLTFAAALCAAGLLAAPALAQDDMAEKMKDDAKSEMTEMAKDTMKDETTKVMTSEDGMMLKGESLSMEDKKAMQKKMLEKKMKEDIGGAETASSAKTYGEDWSKSETKADTLMEKPADAMIAPATATTVNIACPEGTTAQPDGTCMITGDYAGE